MSNAHARAMLRQAFVFNVNSGLEYGLVQKQGGPCGVLAVVQATILQKLIFAEDSGSAIPSHKWHEVMLQRYRRTSFILSSLLSYACPTSTILSPDRSGEATDGTLHSYC